jgi:hypothetical protein
MQLWQASAREQGLSEYAIDALSKMFSYYDLHGFAGNSSVLEGLLGRKPTTFLTFLNRIGK